MYYQIEYFCMSPQQLSALKVKKGEIIKGSNKAFHIFLNKNPEGMNEVNEWRKEITFCLKQLLWF